MKTTVYSKEYRKELPATPGVYRFIDEEGEVLYIGKSINLKNRINSYFQNRAKGDRPAKLLRMQSFITYIEVTLTPTELEAEWLEQALIERHHPQYNQQMKSDSRHGYLILEERNTTWEWREVPLGENVDNQESKKEGPFFIGPFRNQKAVKTRLEILRNFNWIKDWSYQPLPISYSKEELRRALKWIKGVFGSSRNYQGWLEELEKQRDLFAEKLQFEKAERFQELIASLAPVGNALKRNLLLHGSHIPFMIDRKNDWHCGYYLKHGKLFRKCWKSELKISHSEYNEFLRSAAKIEGSLEDNSSYQHWYLRNLEQELILYRAFCRKEGQVIGCLL